MICAFLYPQIRAQCLLLGTMLLTRDKQNSLELFKQKEHGDQFLPTAYTKQKG